MTETCPRRHRWGEEITVSAQKTEQECVNGCGIVKAHRRDGGGFWTEYWRGLDKLSTGKAPACEVT